MRKTLFLASIVLSLSFYRLEANEITLFCSITQPPPPSGQTGDVVISLNIDGPSGSVQRFMKSCDDYNDVKVSDAEIRIHCENATSSTRVKINRYSGNFVTSHDVKSLDAKPFIASGQCSPARKRF